MKVTSFGRVEGGREISGISVFAPPRSGKLTQLQMMQTALGGSRHSRIIVDLRGDCAYGTETIGHEGRFGIYWNALGLPNLPQHSLNPTEDIHLKSGSLFENLAVTLPVVIQPSGAAQSKFFEESAQRYGEPIALCAMEKAPDGVLTVPAIYDAVQALNAGGGRWKHEYDAVLRRSRFKVCTDFADEVQRGYEGASSGFDGTCAELAKSLKSLSSPLLRDSLSPPYDFSFRDLTDPDQLFSVYLLATGDYLRIWNPIYRLIFMAARRAKQRAPAAPKQVWYIDEASAFEKFELIPELYSRGAGDGIIPVTFWQNTSQTKIFGENARLILGAGQRIFYPPNDEISAREISSMIGYETLSYDDEAEQAKSRHAYNQALMSMLSGADMLEAGLEAIHQAQNSARSSKVARLVRQPAEILRTPSNRMWMWIEGIPAPIYARRQAFFDTPWMAGRYTGSPYYPPQDQVKVMTPRGHDIRRVISERVPERYAHFPQYVQSGDWRYVEGFKPC
ncbi:MAG: type IV secretory system conjugative DNA transfer family protein [Henriciella sp.]|nr:type IV secretory system conjugative DNA transfer family protein [Henriciella sp.]